MNMFFRNICVLIAFFLFINSGKAQSNLIDSLRQQVYNSPQADTSKLELLKELADEYYEYDFDSTIYYYNQCLDLSKALPHYEIGFSTLRSFGYTYSFRKNNYEKSLEYFDQAKQLAEVKKDSFGVADALNDMGSVYWKKGQSAKAMELYLQVRKIGEELKDNETLLRSNLSLGIIHNEEGDNVKALLYYEAGLPQADSIGSPVAKGLLLNNMGVAYRSDEKYEDALVYFKKAEEIFLEIERNGRLALVTSNIGENYVLQKDFEQGLKQYKRALDYNSKIDDKEQRVEIYSGIAFAMLEMKNYSQAILNAEKGIELLKDVETELHYEDLYEILAESYEKTGNYKKSLTAIQGYLTAKEKNKSEEASREIERLSFLYEQQKTETEIQKLDLVQEKNARKLDHSEYLVKLLLALISLLIIAAILFFTYNRMQKIKEFDLLKTKMSKDLHDNIGASLNHIKMLSSRLVNKNNSANTVVEDAQHIKKISDELMFDLYDMLWAVDKVKSTLGDLIERMQDHIDNTLREEGYTIHRTFTQSNREIILPVEIKTNVYSIFKEAVHNILKHTEPCNVSFELEYEKNKKMSLLVKNEFDQKIMDPPFSSKKGLGNMRKRADELGGILQIEEHPNSFKVYLEWKI
ncbi:MAG: tetratricopeptide repeat protein [Saprospiraceae bacterium]